MFTLQLYNSTTTFLVKTCLFTILITHASTNTWTYLSRFRYQLFLGDPFLFQLLTILDHVFLIFISLRLLGMSPQEWHGGKTAVRLQQPHTSLMLSNYAANHENDYPHICWNMCGSRFESNFCRTKQSAPEASLPFWLSPWPNRI